jgi:hypothetical protein
LSSYAKWLEEFLLFILKPICSIDEIDNNLLVNARKFLLLDFVFNSLHVKEKSPGMLPGL